MENDNKSFIKFLESKEGALKKSSQLLNSNEEDLDLKTVHELVKVYETENGKILLHKWKEKVPGYMEDFSAMIPQSLNAIGPISSSQDSESLHLEDEQSRGAVARDPEAMHCKDSPFTHEEGNGVVRPAISSFSLDKEGELSWPSLPAPEGDIHSAKRRSTTWQNQKITRRHGQERTTGMPDSCQAQAASANGCTAGISQVGSVLEHGLDPQDQSLATGETGNPTESEDNTESYGLMASLHRESELLRCNLECCEQILRCKTEECAQVRVENYHLERQLEVKHAECDAIRQRIDELTNENTSMLAASNEMTRQLLQLHAKDLEELNRLRERLNACCCNARSRPPPFLDPDDD